MFEVRDIRKAKMIVWTEHMEHGGMVHQVGHRWARWNCHKCLIIIVGSLTICFCDRASSRFRSPRACIVHNVVEVQSSRSMRDNFQDAVRKSVVRVVVKLVPRNEDPICLWKSEQGSKPMGSYTHK